MTAARVNHQHSLIRRLTVVLGLLSTSVTGVLILGWGTAEADDLAGDPVATAPSAAPASVPVVFGIPVATIAWLTAGVLALIVASILVRRSRTASVVADATDADGTFSAEIV